VCCVQQRDLSVAQTVLHFIFPSPRGICTTRHLQLKGCRRLMCSTPTCNPLSKTSCQQLPSRTEVHAYMQAHVLTELHKAQPRASCTGVRTGRVMESVCMCALSYCMLANSQGIQIRTNTHKCAHALACTCRPFKPLDRNWNTESSSRNRHTTCSHIRTSARARTCRPKKPLDRNWNTESSSRYRQLLRLLAATSEEADVVGEAGSPPSHPHVPPSHHPLVVPPPAAGS